MDAPVPPVVRGEFIYRDTLFVDVGGEGKRHPRAYESELKDLLNGKAPKDKVAHWYEAQLIHYGLQRTKEKNTAKVRLQQALSKGQLKAPPPQIADKEADMKKAYASAVRKAKVQGKSEASKTDSAPAAKTKKRKNDEVENESSKRTKVSVNVGGISINIEQGEQQASKKTQATTKKATGDAAKASSKSGKAAASNTAAPSPQKSTAKSNSKASKETKDAAPARVASTSSKAKAKTQNTTTGAAPQEQVKQKPKATPKKKTETAANGDEKSKSASKLKAEPKAKVEPKVKAEPKVKKEAKAAASTKVKKESGIKDEDGDEPMPDYQPEMRSVTGIYNIHSQQLEDQYEKDASNMRLLLCVDNDTNTIWGGFQLPEYTGVLRTQGIAEDLQMTFGWRARGDEGRLHFAGTCQGDIELFGNDQVRGTLFNMYPEPVYFAGRRRPGPLWCGRSVYSFKQEWDGFPKEAYGR